MQARLTYQRPLVNTYCMFDLRRHLRARHSLGPRRSFTVTRSGAGMTTLLSSGNTPGIDYGALAEIQNLWSRRRTLPEGV